MENPIARGIEIGGDFAELFAGGFEVVGFFALSYLSQKRSRP